MLEETRQAQAAWRAESVGDRLGVVRQLRHLIVEQQDGLASAVGGRYGRSVAETLVAEVIPLADACRFLELEARALLRPRRPGRRGRPLWLTRTDVEIHREPHGVVLILAPTNYPLFLPGVQLLQALVAGNAVLLKPAPGCTAVASHLCGLLKAAGLPAQLVQLLDEDIASVRTIIRGHVDHVVLTGSATTGRAVLAELAAPLIPATVELSGNDAVFVLPGADLSFVADALAYGMRLNGGATCIAPRRVFVAESNATELEGLLSARIASLPQVPIAPPTVRQLVSLLEEARRAGCRILGEVPDVDACATTPILVAEGSPELGLLKADVFAPVISIVPIRDTEHALALDNACPYALGASVFGPEAAARQLAGMVNAGVVTINDLIVPTADPRLPFGGRGQSGYGVTRGAEGLLNMTVTKTVSVRGGKFRPHYGAPTHFDQAVFRAYLQAAHSASWLGRCRAAYRLVRALVRQSGAARKTRDDGAADGS